MYTLHFKLEETGNLRHNDTTDKNLQHLLFHQILASSAAPNGIGVSTNIPFTFLIK